MRFVVDTLHFGCFDKAIFLFMAITREKKEKIVEKISGAMNTAGSVVFVGFHKLGVGETSAMRSALKGEGVSYTVAKKSLIQRVLGTMSIEGEAPVMSGEVAIAYGEDLVAPARGVQTFVKKHKNELAILGGVFEGRYMTAAEMTDIASIPSRQVLYAQFVNLINTPIQQFAVAVDQIAKKKESNA